MKQSSFIVKVQRAVYPPGSRNVLIYNESRYLTFMLESDHICDLLGIAPKKYFTAHLNKDREIVLDHELEESEWPTW